MKKQAWFFLLTVIILIIVLNILVRCEGGDNGGDSEKKVSYQKTPEYPRAYWETRKPDTVTTYITVRVGEWCQPIKVESRNWFWAEFTDQKITDSRVYIRLATQPKLLESAEVRSSLLNTNKDPIPGSYSEIYIQFMLPPDTKLRGELPKIAFRTRGMR